MAKREVKWFDSIGTMTKFGFIPHKKHPKGFLMPVKLKIRHRARTAYYDEFQEPLMESGCLVYALPGGGEYVEKMKW